MVFSVLAIQGKLYYNICKPFVSGSVTLWVACITRGYVMFQTLSSHTSLYANHYNREYIIDLLQSKNSREEEERAKVEISPISHACRNMYWGWKFQDCLVYVLST